MKKQTNKKSSLKEHPESKISSKPLKVGKTINSGKQTNKQGLAGCLPQPECSGEKEKKMPQRFQPFVMMKLEGHMYIILNFCKILSLLTENTENSS